MATQNWGECKSCQYFEIEPEAKPEPSTLGLCIVHELEPYHLRVSGASGCTSFKRGEVAHAAGASEAPPHSSH